jgi:hypothetical protein
VFGALKIKPRAAREAAAVPPDPVLVRLAAVSDLILSGAPAPQVFDAAAAAVVECAGAEFAVVRTAKPGGDVFEVRAHAGLSLESPAPISASSVSRDTWNALRLSGRPCGEGFVVESKDLAGAREGVVPMRPSRDGRLVLLAAVGGADDPAGFIAAGFFAGPPGPPALAAVSAFSKAVLHLLQRDGAEAGLRDRERTLDACREELDGVNRLKSNFLSVVSHELRTPLTSIKAYNETLLENIDTIKRETLEDFLRVMNEENERLIALVDSMLNFSRLETGHLKVERVSCNLNRLVEEVHDALRPAFLERDIDTELRLPRHQCRIDADVELIRQLLRNLMNNAAKFTPTGGSVTVTLEEEASAARVAVQDTGPGVPEDQLEKVFERFHQADTSDTREHGGPGLGLAICKNIVEWHDGRIWVENVKDAGAKFVVVLPMKDIVVRRSSAPGLAGSLRFERERYLTLLVEMLAEFLQARKASIMLLDRRRQTLHVIAAKGLDPDFVQNTRLTVGERIAGKVAETGEPLHVFDIESDADYGRANNALFYGTRSFISVPLKDGDETIGVLNVSDHVEGREFARADREILEALGGIIAGMLKKLDAFEKVSANFEKLKDAMRSILDMREAWGSRALMNLTLVALTVGKRLGLDERSLTALRLGMNLYDLGLMRIPRAIRMKREELSERERETLREHTNVGYALSSPMGLEDRVMKMVRSHHEHFDGTGYPDGLAGNEIPVEARIVSVVDAFRALMSEGPYRRTFTLAEARAEIAAGAGTRFDPRVAAAFGDALDILGARSDRRELVLEEFERELERERSARMRGAETRQEHASKEEAR